MMPRDVDLFVIGGGSGGVRAARTAAATGARVALAESRRMGGTCVIRGCVPKKLMVFASEFREQAALARGYGWNAEAGAFEWQTFRAKLDAELDRLEDVYRKLLTSSGVTMHDTRAQVSGPNTVELGDGTRVAARHILVATGGHPVRPDVPGAALGMVSDDVFKMETLPGSMLVVGGGYIACEFACILNGMGVEVTQFYRGPQILRGFDDEARDIVASRMRGQGIDLQVNTNVVDLRPAGADTAEGGASRPNESGGSASATGSVVATDTNGVERRFESLLFATGRAPNSKDIGLEMAGVAVNQRGAIEVDAYSQTAVPSIHAIGDVTDRVNLTPVAIREGQAFTETVFKGNPTAPDHDLVASTVFTQPELGTVGLTEEAAREQEEIEVYSTSFNPMRTAFGDRPNQVLMKLVVSRASRKVLGCHIVSDGAGELIQMVGIAVKAGLTKEDFDRTVAVHPTVSEELVTMQTPTRAT
ncbi:MAG: glutathione-disulfide reductase [Boseongicola sp. SB0677_bin_26]|nr:glutathione-disulfide reductase [Boseongicola sp. SB0665_bin_10]MYG26449.1 glutathione-disulfide reductase [Boseongicola sp. SB0677_bin_26]